MRVVCGRREEGGEPADVAPAWQNACKRLWFYTPSQLGIHCRAAQLSASGYLSKGFGFSNSCIIEDVAFFEEKEDTWLI